MSDSSLRRRRIINSLTVIRLVLQVLIRNPTLLGARWWLQLALNAVEDLTTELTQDPSPESAIATAAARSERPGTEETRR